MKHILLVLLLVGIGFPARAAIMDSGTDAPSSSVGNDGDLYHRTDVPSVYGPKASGAWPSTFSYIVGQGCTTVYHIDKDCDGYGVGPTTITTDPNPLFGPDADDNDATVNTPASVLTKYGSINAFLTHLGYPTNRVFYINPVNGVDASGCGTISSPCQHFSYSAIGTVLNDGAGGTVMYRASSSAGLQICTGGGCYYPRASSSTSPIVIMAYPGEQVTFLAPNAPLNLGGGSYNASTNLILSGFSVIASSSGAGYGLLGNWNQNVTLENSELAGWSMAVQIGSGSQNTTITQNLFHDISEHAVYPVTGDQSKGVYSTGMVNCSKWTWQPNNTNYNPHFNFNTTSNVMLYVGAGGYDAIHYNGEICGGLISSNILIDGGGTAIGLQDGNQNVTVSNNLVANNSSAQILLYIYGCENNGSAVTSGQIGASCDSNWSNDIGTIYYPNMENANIIINNTLWTGINAPSSYFCYPGDCSQGYYGLEEAVHAEGIPGGRWIKNTIIQNNLIVTYDGNGGSTYPQLWFDRNSYPETNTLANNLLWNAYTGNSSSNAMLITSNSLSCASAPWYCGGSTIGTYGSGSAHPGTYSFSQFQSYNRGSNTKELWGNPAFADVQTSYSTTPNMFNFRLLLGSPAIGAGLANGAPSTDITGATRASTPSIGAYDYTALTSLACTPTSVTTGTSVDCTVTLPQAATGNAVIALSSSSAAVVVPANVTIAAGASSATFTVTVGSGSPGQTVVLSAAFSGTTQTAPLTFPSAPCDLNGDGVINSVDVQLAINQALGLTLCTNADLQTNGQCTVVDVQRVINASLSGTCRTGP